MSQCHCGNRRPEEVIIANASFKITDWVDFMNLLKLRCRKLSAIRLQIHDRFMMGEQVEPAFVDLLCSYGAQLTGADILTPLKEQSLKRIVHECGSLKYTYFDRNPFNFGILRNHIESLSLLLTYDIAHSDLDALAVAIKSTSSLEKLYASIPDCALSHRGVISENEAIIAGRFISWWVTFFEISKS